MIHKTFWDVLTMRRIFFMHNFCILFIFFPCIFHRISSNIANVFYLNYVRESRERGREKKREREKEKERGGKREHKNDSRVAETEINWQKHLLWRKTISTSAFLEHTIRHSPLFANQAGKSI